MKAAETAGEAAFAPRPLDRLGPLVPEGQSLPTFATLDGRPVAVLALDDYRRLVSAATAVLARDASRKPAPRRAGSVSTIQRDPEVAAFLLDLFGKHATVGSARAACLERFGAARTPSSTRITTFRLRTR